jgi:hypothetical protein
VHGSGGHSCQRSDGADRGRRRAPISTDDQGRVIAHLLASPEGHQGRIYTLHGPVEMSYGEIAAAMTEVLGAHVAYAPTSIDEFRQKVEQLYKFPLFLVQHLEVAQNYQEGVFPGTNTLSRKSPARLRFRCRPSSKKTRRRLSEGRCLFRRQTGFDRCSSSKETRREDLVHYGREQWLWM